MESLSNFLNLVLVVLWVMAFVLLIVAVLIFALKKAPIKKNSAAPRHTRNRFPQNTIIFGRDKCGRSIFSPGSAEGHIGVIGPSGKGKTSALIIPTLQSWGGEGYSSFSIDISGDINIALQHLPRKIIYAPWSDTSVIYDVFAYIDGLEPSDQDEELSNLALMMIPSPRSGESNGAEEYFRAGGVNILTAALLAGYHKGMDFCEICKCLLTCDLDALFEFVSSSGYPKAMYYISQYIGSSTKNIAGCKQIADDAAKLFALNARLSETIRRAKPGEMKFSPDMVATHNCFLVIPDNKLEQMAPLLRIVVSQVMNYCAALPLDNPFHILITLDELASLGQIDLLNCLRKYRKRHVRLLWCSQSIADLDMIYGATQRKTIMDNIAYTVVLGARDPETQEYLAKLIGQRQQEERSTTYRKGLLLSTGDTSVTTRM